MQHAWPVRCLSGRNESFACHHTEQDGRPVVAACVSVPAAVSEAVCWIDGHTAVSSGECLVLGLPGDRSYN